jgi:HD superfamily phosphohydrolase
LIEQTASRKPPIVEYTDRIYGTVAIESPILLTLMQTHALRRLHGVLQHGISGLLGITRPTSRFEHCVGVMILARSLGASLHEQVAALLHDVSHTAFSHVIDYVYLGHDSQSYHEDVKESYFAQTDLPAVLACHGYDWRRLLDETAFPILEQPAPALCADRLDYFLRDSLDLGLATLTDIRSALSSLVVHNGQIAVVERDAALWIADTYMAADNASWANLREVGLYELCARAIRRALALGVITDADIWGTDADVWARLGRNDDAELQALIRLVSADTGFVIDEHAPTFRVSTKLRTVDPQVLVDGRLTRLSALDVGFARRRAAYLRAKSGQWPIRVIPPRDGN